MILQINKQKALEAISGLRSRIYVLKTKKEKGLDYQSWKDEAEESCKYATEYNSQHGGSHGSMFCFLTIPLNIAAHLCMLFIWVESNELNID